MAMLLKSSAVQSLNVAHINTNSRQPLSLSLHTNQTHSSCPVTSPSPSTKFFNLASYIQAMSNLHLSSIQLNDLFNAAQLSANSTLVFNKLNESSNVTQSSLDSTIAQSKSLKYPMLLNLCPNQQFTPIQLIESPKRYLISAQFVNCHPIRLSTRPSCNAPAQISTRPTKLLSYCYCSPLFFSVKYYYIRIITLFFYY